MSRKRDNCNISVAPILILRSTSREEKKTVVIELWKKFMKSITFILNRTKELSHDCESSRGRVVKAMD